MGAELDRAVTRERAYTLLGSLVRYGVTEATLPATRAALGEPLEVGDLDELAATHHSLFGLDVPPYQSFFLTPERLLGGDQADAVAAAYASGGFAPRVADTSSDHLGIELAFLGWLAGAGVDALRDERTREVFKLHDLERAFLDDHLLRWLPAVVASVCGTDPDGEGLFERALDLACDLAFAHRDELGGDRTAWSLPPVPKVEHESLREIAELLCTPCLAGGLLTRTAIQRIARSQQLPRGFGERPRELRNVLLSSARFGRLGITLQLLDDEFARQAAVHTGGPWGERIRQTRALVAKMTVAVEAATEGGSSSESPTP